MSLVIANKIHGSRGIGNNQWVWKEMGINYMAKLGSENGNKMNNCERDGMEL